VTTLLFAARLDILRIQGPLACADGWAPEPDVALAPWEDRTRHPTTAALVVEVAVTAHAEARRKLLGYALAGVETVWVVDVPARAVDVLTQPTGTGYTATARLAGNDVLDPNVSGIEVFTVTELFGAAQLDG